MESTLIKAGQLTAFESGEYSDYQVEAFMVALTEFDVLVEHELSKAEQKSKPDGGDGKDFLPWLTKKGYLLDVSFKSIHMGNYGDVELSIRG